MSTTHDAVDEILDKALSAARSGTDALHVALDGLSAPIYVTGPDGFVTYFNPACIDFAGQTPVIGQAQWCVTWKLFSIEGDPLPHDQCPMAVSVRTQRPVRDVIAIAERPDGTRVTFQPYPTPLFAEDGSFEGAINLLIDVGDWRQAEFLRQQALRCRRLVKLITDRQAVEALTAMAEEYEQKAQELSGR